MGIPELSLVLPIVRYDLLSHSSPKQHVNQDLGSLMARKLLAALSLVAVAGCGTHLNTTQSPQDATTSGVPATTASSAESGSPTQSAVIRELTSDPQVGATLAPPPEDARPATDAANAYSVYQETLPHEWDTYPHSVQLTLYSSSVYGEIQADGSVKPTYEDVLAWAVIYRGVPIHKIGGAPPIQTDLPTPSPAITPSCDFVFLVDATTGKYMHAFDECPGRL